VKSRQLLANAEQQRRRRKGASPLTYVSTEPCNLSSKASDNMPRLPAFRTRRRGLGLIDLVVVIAVMGIIAAAGGLRYAAAAQRYAVQQATQRIAADLEFARNVARIRRQSVTITFVPANHRYTSTAINDPDHPASGLNVNLRSYSSSVSLASAAFGGDAAIQFNAYGVPDSGGTATVSCGSYSQTVTVAAGTGGVSVP
jgi:type II secretory pathway pseudopilin PulG